MNKKINRNIILLIIALVVGFVVYDFVKDSSQEEAEREAASQPEEIVMNEDNEELDPEEETEFSTSDDLEEERVVEEEQTNMTNQSPQIYYGANPGDTAYDYDLIDIQTGELVKLSDYRGQKVFLNFWASWCPPCRVEAPHLQRFSENQDDVVVLGVNVKTSESSEENIQGFIDEFGLTFQNVYGPEEMFGPFFVESLPTSFFIDSAGVIRERVTGPVTEDVLYAIFEMMD